MKFVLIFVLITQMFGSVSVTAEFDSVKACEAANNDLRLLHRSIIEGHNAYMLGKCYPKVGKP